MSRFPDYSDNEWNDAYTCHCTHSSKPWCNCPPNCQECIEEEESYNSYCYDQDHHDDHDDHDDQHDDLDEMSWKYSNHHEFGYQTNKLFATLLLGIQRLEDTAGLPLAHQAMLEEMLECWTEDDNTSAADLF